jgi:hypothetical protein
MDYVLIVLIILAALAAGIFVYVLLSAREEAGSLKNRDSN